MLDIDKAFNPETKSVHAYFQSPGVGFYIPLYQREYSWDNDNIDQLLDDVASGIDNLVASPKDEIRFLGTIIAVKVVDKRSIYPRDPQGLPSSIENFIDGKQRLSTIALFSTLLHKNILLYEKKLRSSEEEEILLIEQMKEACSIWKERLIDIFSLDLKRGTPQRKPKIIRGNKDQWTKEGNIQDNYLSDVANYLAHYIYYLEDDKNPPPKPNKSTRAGKNISRIERWLKRIVIPAHVNETSDFLPSWSILKEVEQEHIWKYDRDELKDVVAQMEAVD